MDKSTLLKQLDNIIAQLIEKYKPEKIILFGSAVWGEKGDELCKHKPNIKMK